MGNVSYALGENLTKSEGKRHLEDTRVGARMKLKWILKMPNADRIHLTKTQGIMVGSCGYSNELSGFIKRGQFLRQLVDYQPLKRYYSVEFAIFP
jgi:hypothetical protein